jgi:hypothetical protein
MAKSKNASRESQTHFEQVPVEVVKKIAESDVSKGQKAGTAQVASKRTSGKKS